MTNVYNIMPADNSEFLGNKLEENWKNEVHAAKEDSRKPKFFTALKKTFIWSFFYYGGWILMLTVVVRTMQIYILGLFIWHFDPRAASTQEEAYLYASGMIILTIMVVMITHHSNLGLMEIGMRVRIASSSLIYRKILRLSSSTITSPGQIVNLLSNDMSKFEQLFTTLHYIWILPIQGSIIAFLIWQSVGIASLAGVFLIIIQTIPLQGYISKCTSKLRSKIAVRTDERIRLMSEIIKGIQVIKMYTWEKPFAELVNRARKYEIDVLTLISYLRGFTLATCVFTERTTLYFTIMAYVLYGHSISADKVFSLAQYFNILQLTMAIFYPMAVAGAAEAAVSIKRIIIIEKFCINAFWRDLELSCFSLITLSYIKWLCFILCNSGNWTLDFLFINFANLNSVIRHWKINHYIQLGLIISPNIFNILMKNVKNLCVFNFQSSFLQAILGELKSSQGQIHINGKISYVSQEPWLFTGTVRNNILFGQPYDNNRYQNVVDVCALTKDFEQFPYGDKTLVGERGTALSGGQRARINLARAIYRDADIYLFDDPLSAVDTHVGRHLFNECMNNYLRNKTRILVTHQLQYLKQCDYIVILNNVYEGTFAALQEKRAIFLEILMKAEEVNEKTKEALKTYANPMSDIIQNSNVNDEDMEKAEPQETEELLAKGSLSTLIYWKYLRSGASIIMIVSFLFCLILGQIGSNGCDYWVGYWTRQEEMRIKAMRELQHITNNFTILSSTLKSTGQKENASDINNDLTEFLTITDYYKQNFLLFYNMSISCNCIVNILLLYFKLDQNVGIVGRTGAGKSSLIAALFRMAKLDGTIYIDNVDTKKIGLHDLRNKISIIPQEPVLFSSTLRDNLDPFYKFHDADLWSVLEEVKLKHMVGSLDYHVEQDGSNFSVGQRQLVCLARAILQANKILVLDEATANVDPTTDALIQTTIRKKFEDCTVLTIAHRLNTIMDNDKVLTMDQGQMLEFDHPYILLQNEQGHFSSMVQETGKTMTEQLKQCAKEVNQSLYLRFYYIWR
ncbi:hypothetical protein ALC62_13171 [Cyphomyrmex costatus]|uniref:Multidrug resistance-associated protein 4 n=1 Tax=Cyphomyrmex costatus TaxID=456900 RepID=A0A195C658_9HYME|nr:hypothetical protein ALC62_13171 [Cyphomyrmex costatus]